MARKKNRVQPNQLTTEETKSETENYQEENDFLDLAIENEDLQKKCEDLEAAEKKVEEKFVKVVETLTKARISLEEKQEEICKLTRQIEAKEFFYQTVIQEKETALAAKFRAAEALETDNQRLWEEVEKLKVRQEETRITIEGNEDIFSFFTETSHPTLRKLNEIVDNIQKSEFVQVNSRKIQNFLGRRHIRLYLRYFIVVYFIFIHFFLFCSFFH